MFAFEKRTFSVLKNIGSIQFSASSIHYTQEKNNYKLVVVGGGSGGLTIASKFNKILGVNNVALVEPSDWHC